MISNIFSTPCKAPIACGLLLAVFASAGCNLERPYISPKVGMCEHPALAHDAIRSRVLLFGDGGELTDPNLPILDSLTARASLLPEKTTVVLLGDNIYPRGLPDSSRGDAFDDAKRKLSAQLTAVARSGAHGLVIPGNHDWDFSGPDGWNALLRQASFVETGFPGSRFAPQDGCPGPVIVDTEGARLIAFDSEWWMRKDAKPVASCFDSLDFTERMSREDSVNLVKEATLVRLEVAIRSSEANAILVMAHHPLATHGPHGGFFDWVDHLFPLRNLNSKLWIPAPLVLLGVVYFISLLAGWRRKTGIVIASIVGILSLFIYPVGRQLLRVDQDLTGRGNRELVNAYRSTLVEADSLNEKLIIYVAGHEHSLQVLKGSGGEEFVLVSGAGSHVSKVGKGDDTLFAHSHTGFMQLDFLDEGHVRLTIVEPEDSKSEGGNGFTMCLK